jgi:RNA polymerase sigma-70 factor (ECF subfamily)
MRSVGSAIAEPLTRLAELWTRKTFELKTKELLPSLYRTAVALTGSPSDAEDLVQEAYLKAFIAFRDGELKGDVACRAWLKRIVVNLYRDWYRRRTRSPELLVLDEDDGSGNGGTIAELMPSGAPGPAELYQAKSIRQAIAAALDRLAPELRVVFVLNVIEELSYQQIAEATACPIGTVMSRLYRARRLVKVFLHESGYGDRPGLVLPKRRRQAGASD